MKYKAVIFDLFGTLVESFSGEEVERMLDDTATSLGIPGDEFRRIWVETIPRRAKGEFPPGDETFREVCEMAGVEPPGEEVMREAMVTRVEYFRVKMVPRPDALETIARLKEAGLKVGLLSDCSWEPPGIWPHTELAGAIDDPVFSCDVGMKKPEPEIYHLTCRRLGVEPGECLYVGDGGSQELSGAEAAGLTPLRIWVPRTDGGQPFQLEPDEWEGPTVGSLTDVLKYALGE